MCDLTLVTLGSHKFTFELTEHSKKNMISKLKQIKNPWEIQFSKTYLIGLNETCEENSLLGNPLPP